MCLPKVLAEKAVALMASQVAADELIAADIAEGKTFEEASRARRAGVRRVEDLG